MGSKPDGWVDAGAVDRGINVQSIDYSPGFSLHQDSKNVTSGIHRGLGPRYGMSPIPGHSINVDQTTSIKGMRRQEEDGTYPKKKFFACIPVNLLEIDSDTSKKQHYVWAFTYTDGSDTLVGIEISSVGTAFPFMHPDISKGVMANRFTYTSELSGYFHLSPIIGSGTTESIAWQKKLLITDSSKNHISSAAISVSGKQVPTEWLMGQMTSTSNQGSYWTHKFGLISPLCIPQGPKDTTHYMEFHRNYLSVLQRIYFYNAQPTQVSSYLFRHTKDYGTSTSQIDPNLMSTFESITHDATYDGRSTTGALGGGGAYIGLVHIEDLKHIIDYNIIFFAGDRPYGFFLRDTTLDNNSSCGAIIDPSSFAASKVKSKPTTLPNSTTKYTEDGDIKETCWEHFPAYVSGTPLAKNSVATRAGSDNIDQVTLGAANSGVLRANTTYEVAYSYYNRELDFETNVGLPARIQTGTDDYVSLSIARNRDEGAGSLEKSAMYYSSVNSVDIDFHYIGSGEYISNYMDIVFYYRALGTFEWLPAGRLEFPRYFAQGNFNIRWICTGDHVGLPGGQPGAFQDYSTLPNEPYFDVKNFNNRVFWMSKSNIAFSLKDKPLVYPLRNTVASASGFYRGMTIHTYPGQSTQESRLMIWGSKDVYIGKFTGRPLKQPVRVSSTEVGSFDLEGSDFQVEQWTTHTAFSHRSATVALGYLYWWGPDGVFMDDGREIPRKISSEQEPDIFGLYDPATVDDIHCVYNDSTKEIIWFYFAKAGDGNTSKGLALNVETKEFYNMEFDGIVDNSQYINIENDNSNKELSGKRTILGVRETSASAISRPVFFDHNNRAGDFLPTTELLFKSVAAGSSSSSRLFTLMDNYNTTMFAAISVNDLIHLHQAKKYGGISSLGAGVMTDADDFVGKVIAKGSGTLTIELPSGVSFDTATTLELDAYLPAWHSQHQIDYLIKTQYWLTNGLQTNQFFRQLHMLFKLNLIPSVVVDSLLVRYRVPTMEIGEFQGRDSDLAINSDEAMQLYHGLEGLDLEGQAIQLNISGSHFKHEWVLQYLAAYVQPNDYEFLQQFEG